MITEKTAIDRIAENKSAEWTEMYRKETDMNKIIMLADAFSCKYEVGKTDSHRVFVYIHEWRKTLFFEKTGKITKVVEHEQ